MTAPGSRLRSDAHLPARRRLGLGRRHVSRAASASRIRRQRQRPLLRALRERSRRHGLAARRPGSGGEAALRRADDVAADVVLLPHHGSRSSSSPELVRAVSRASRHRIGRLRQSLGHAGCRRGRALAGGRHDGSRHGRGGRDPRAFPAAPGTTRRIDRSGMTVRAGGGDGARWLRARGQAEAAARYHAAPCGKSSSRAAPSCGRSSCARWSPPPSCWSGCGRCSASA